MIDIKIINIELYFDLNSQLSISGEPPFGYNSPLLSKFIHNSQFTIHNYPS